ncbi:MULTISPECIES: hypothetical protein [Thermomonospora]|uniref:Uncharacterized protein n=1 Tax=Thermomonospora cellulosilytica TaxID=1411118 RepID=A0A7W3N3D1_9ACTN|nr:MULTISPECIES: hypothetical protein [Thermomonospora]MBA9006816.1 hypothetical protein [Thermomonospora cellulosilytica]
MSRKYEGWAQQHPTKTLIDPDEGPVEIDVEMVPLMEALWANGYTTIMSCQDIGESILTGGTAIPEHLWEKTAAFYKGAAWLKVPADDGIELMKLFEPIFRPGEWLAQVPIMPGGLCSWASIHFPREQIGEAVALLEARLASGTTAV